MRHLDEGTIHAWLDGALGSEDARIVESHLAECASCAASVADARGLVAASSRILSALDVVPGGVIPERSREGAGGGGGDPARRAAWWRSPLARVAAAVVVMVMGAVAVSQRGSRRAAGNVIALRDTAAVERVSVETSRAPAEHLKAQATTPAAPSAPAAAPKQLGGTAGNALDATDAIRRDEQAVAAGAAAQASRAAVPPAPEAPPKNAPSAPPSRGVEKGALMDGAAKSATRAVAAPANELRSADSIAGLRQPVAWVRGRVVSDEGTPLAGAQVLVPGARNAGALTGGDGRYAFAVPASNVADTDVSLVARRIGYEAATAAVRAAPGDTLSRDFTLHPSRVTLSEAVVTTHSAGMPRLVHTDTLRVAGQPVRRTTYELGRGVMVTLEAWPPVLVYDSVSGNEGAVLPKQPGGANAIEWRGADGTAYVLSGPVPVDELRRVRRALGM